jgi:hypothetical protein
MHTIHLLHHYHSHPHIQSFSHNNIHTIHDHYHHYHHYYHYHHYHYHSPEAAAKARSESLLRSTRFSQRNRIIAPKSSDLLNIEKISSSNEPFSLIGHEDNDMGNGVIENEEGGGEI